MSIECLMLGGLGNDMFQYAIARLLAEQHGLALVCHPSSQWVNDDRRPLTLAGRSVLSEPTEYDVLADTGWSGHTFPFAELLRARYARRLKLRGYFQRAEYVEPFLHRFRDWFRPCPPLLPSIRPRDVGVAVFGSTRPTWMLPPSYYTCILSSLTDLGVVYVCGASVPDALRATLRPFRPVYLKDGPMNTLALLSRFRRLIMANHPLAWWAGILGEADELFGSHSADGVMYAFSGFQDVDLRIRDGRYRDVSVEVPGTWTRVLTSAARGATVFHAEDALLVGRASYETVRVPTDGIAVSDLVALLHAEEPVAVEHVVSRYRVSEPGAVLARLRRAGLIRIEQTFVPGPATPVAMLGHHAAPLVPPEH